MNALSWLLYFGNIAANFHVLFIICGIICLPVTAIYVLVACASLDGPYVSDEHKKSVWVKAKKSLRLVWLAFAFWLLAAFMPSQDTMYAVAASQVSEQLLHSKTANLAEQALDAWLQRQIHSAPPSDASK